MLKSNTRKDNIRWGNLFVKITLYVLSLTVAFMCLFPIYLLFVSATRSTEALRLGFSLLPSTNFVQNYRNLIAFLNTNDLSILRAFFNSIFVAFASTLLSVYFSALTAYAFHVYEFKGKAFLEKLILFIIIVPGQLGMIGFFKLVMNLGIYDTFVPLIVPAIASASTVFFLKQYLQNNFSKDYIDAARIDGANEFAIFNLICLPFIKPALATMALFGVIASWNSYMGPLLFLQSPSKYTLPLVLNTLKANIYSLDYGALYLGVVITVIPMLVVYFFMSKAIMDGVSTGGLK